MDQSEAFGYVFPSSLGSLGKLFQVVDAVSSRLVKQDFIVGFYLY